MNLTLILAKVTYLKRHPEAWDPVIPHGGPVFHTAISEYIVATLARQIGGQLKNRELTDKLNQTAKLLVDGSSKLLGKDSEAALDSDDLCPPWPRFRIPPPRRGDPGPQPDPWFSLFEGSAAESWIESAPDAIKEIALAVAIRDLASITTIASASAAFKETGEAAMKQACNRAFDDYCGTPVKPHVPAPPKKSVAA